MDACARGLIRKRLLPDVCSYYVSSNMCGSERPARRLPRLACHLFSFKFSELSDSEEVKYRNKCISH